MARAGGAGGLSCMAPASMTSTRPQRAASARSCVTSTSVVSRAGVELEQQLRDARAGRGIEIARGLIGKQHRRRADRGARQRHALLFAAGELARVVLQRAHSSPRAPSMSLAALRASRRPASSSGSMTFSSAVSDGTR